MRTSLIQFAFIVLFFVVPQGATGGQGSLPTDHHMNLFSRPGRYTRLVRDRGRLGIRLEPVAAGPQGQAAVKPQPLSQEQVLELLKGGVPNQHVTALVTERGIDFQVDEDYVRTLRKAGGNDQLIAALRKAGGKMAHALVETSPNAEVFLDGELQGQADKQGVLTLRAKPGSHALKVSLAGKRSFEQNVTLAEGQPTRIDAQLADLSGSLRVRTLAEAAIWLDNSSRGTADSTGELLLSNVPSGTHLLRVSARGKVDNSQNVNIAAGAETLVDAMLPDGVRTNPQDGLKYVWISPGTFMMGCSQGDNDCSDPEKPAHRVIMHRDYWIGQTEVTVAAYRRFADATKTKMPPSGPKSYHDWTEDKLPIIDVTWGEANQFCAWAGGRLPSEAEWEYAARGGSSQTRYGTLSEIAWCKENAGNHTHEVATRLPNAYGLFDMLGNVWEWVNDWYDANYYQTNVAQDPPGPASGQEKVLRGGSWIVNSTLLRVSDRYSIKPDARSDFFGFRCVSDAKNP
jgi:sulfatase modifying factor 1